MPDEKFMRHHYGPSGYVKPELLDSKGLSLVDWIDERYQNAKSLEDASYLLRCREALKYMALASSDEHPNVPLRMHIALRILQSFNHGEAGFNAVIVGTVNDWIEGGMHGPVPWPNSPFFDEWAERNGYARIGRYVGFKFQAQAIDAAMEPGSEGM